jgi:trk system potassium uptake protein TrkH
LLYGFIGLIALGTLLLALPFSDAPGQSTSFIVALFTATSAVTVTGHTAVSTTQHWSYFGQAVIFILMLVGGLGFMAGATFVLELIGRQKTSISHQLVLRETMGEDEKNLGGLGRTTRNIVIVAFLLYVLGALIFLPRIQEITEFGFVESLWQSLFLSVSSFNNAGFSILPEVSGLRSLAILDNQWLIQAVMVLLIMIGGIGWAVLVDIRSKKRIIRLSLDTKLVLLGSILLWAIGFFAYFLAGYVAGGSQDDNGLGHQVGAAIFHSISGRTAGFIIADFGAAEDFTKLVFTFLMLIGGASGSVAGGIKINTFMVLIVAVISSIRARQQAEAFGREIPQTQVFRALAVAALATVFIVVTVPILTITEAGALRAGDLKFLDLFFDTVSAFATNGSSTGIVPDLGTAGKLIFVAAMFVGRIGPLTLALTLAPEDKTLYRYVREPVKIG